jgi:hypothetical protein
MLPGRPCSADEAAIDVAWNRPTWTSIRSGCPSRDARPDTTGSGENEPWSSPNVAEPISTDKRLQGSHLVVVIGPSWMTRQPS